MIGARGRPTLGWRVVVGATVVAGALAGCGSGDADGDRAGPSSATSDTAESTPTSSAPSTPAMSVPEMPAVAREKTQDGAVAFVRHYWDLVNYAAATGDTDPIWAIADPECKDCKHITDGIDEVYRTGAVMTGQQFEIGAVAAPEPPPNGVITVTVEYSQPVGVLVSKAGVPTTYPAVERDFGGAVIDYDDDAKEWVFVGFGSIG